MGRGLHAVAIVSVGLMSLLGVQPAAHAVRDSAQRRQTAAPIAQAAATPGAQLWFNRYNGTGNDSDAASALGVSPDGSRVFVTGASDGLNGAPDYATVAYNASTGAQLWVKRYNGPANGSDYAYALGVSPDGSKVFVTGQSRGSTSSDDYATVAYNAATGAKLWVSRYSGTARGDYDDRNALGVSPDGTKVFVTGGTGSGDYATVAYNAATGTQLWVERYNGPGNGDDDAFALGVSPDGSRVFVTGLSQGTTTGEDYATVAYNASTGAQLWVKRYNGPGNSFDDAYALGVSPDGSKVFVTGSSEGSSGYSDYATVAYNAATGAKLWVNRYDGGLFDDASALGVSPDGSKVFVTGVSTWVRGSTSSSDFGTVAYNAATGAQLWVKHYNGPASSADAASALRVSPDGSKVFVTGSSQGFDTHPPCIDCAFPDYATVAYNAATGAKLWVNRYGTLNNFDYGRAIGVSPNGSRVFVTGLSQDPNSRRDDYATVAYSVG